MDVAITGIGLHPFGRFDGTTVTELGGAARQRIAPRSLRCNRCNLTALQGCRYRWGRSRSWSGAAKRR